MAKTQTAEPSPAVSGADIAKKLRGWVSRNRHYLIAFFVPVILMCIAYAIFGLYPFGKKSVLALDLNAQYVYFFEALRDAFWGDGSPFYSWSRNLSGGFMGIIGYYLASPYTLIVMLLPRKMILTSLLIMILCKIGSASVTFSLYLRKSKHLDPMQATVFGVLFSLCAYMVIQTVDPMWLDGLVLLPLTVLGLERMIDTGKKLLFIIPTAMMFVANFYIGYMIAIFTAIYFVYYLFFGTEERRGKWKNYVFICVNYVISMAVTCMLSAFMILPVYNALSLGKFDFSNPDYSFKTQFDPVDILAQLLTCQYDSVNVQGSPEIYCGILVVALLPLFFLSSRITLKQKLGKGFLLVVMFFSMYIKPVDMWWHGGQVPNWLPYRYSFILSFILLTMAATALSHLDGVKISHFGGVFFGILAAVLYLQGRGYEHLGDMRSIWLTIGLAAAYLGFLYCIAAKKGKGKALPAFMAVLLCGELVFNSVCTLRSLDKEVTYSTKESYETFMISGRKTVDLMEQHDSGLYRSEKTFSRCINDNLAWGLKGLTHSSSVMNTRALKFIETLGYNSRSYYTRYEGTTELADSLLGIKYVIDRDNGPEQQALAASSSSETEKINLRRRWLLHEAYQEVDHYTFTDTDKTEKTFTIYENPNALSIGYMVDDDLKRIDHLGNDNPFNSQNILFSTMLGYTQFDEENKITDHSSYYTRIDTGEPVLGAVTVGDYNGQACYTKMDSGDPTVDYRFTAESDEEIFCFLKTQNEQEVNLWLGVYDEAAGTYRFGNVGYGQYFKTHNYSIISLGSFTPGTKVALRLTVLDEDKATIIKEPFFYYFNRAAFQQDIDRLKTQQMKVTKYNSTFIKGTVNTQEGQILFTSIPYEPGWTVRVDGKRVFTTGAPDTEIRKYKDEEGKTQISRKEKHQTLKAMMYVNFDDFAPGEHTVVMSYTPPGLVPGIFLLILGVGFVILIWWTERRGTPIGRSRKK